MHQTVFNLIDFETYDNVLISKNGSHWLFADIYVYLPEDENFKNLQRIYTDPHNKDSNLKDISARILQQITGYGRMVIYKCTGTEKDVENPDNLELVALKEGKFEKGKLHGYGREIKKDDKINLGYFKNGEPFGKHIFVENDKIHYEGLVADEKEKHEIESFESKNVGDDRRFDFWVKNQQSSVKNKIKL